MSRTPSLLAPRNGDVLLIIDVQEDFLPGGKTIVPRAEKVVSRLNVYIQVFHRAGLPIVATRDWHPSNHCSFKSQGGRWPAHCIAGSHGACFAEMLQLPCEVPIVSKATFPDAEAASGFDATELDGLLRNNGINRLFVGGMATDHGVLNTVLDAQKLGYQTVLLRDAICSVDFHIGDGERAISAMRKSGAMLATLGQLETGACEIFC